MRRQRPFQCTVAFLAAAVGVAAPSAGSVGAGTPVEEAEATVASEPETAPPAPAPLDAPAPPVQGPTPTSEPPAAPPTTTQPEHGPPTTSQHDQAPATTDPEPAGDPAAVATSGPAVPPADPPAGSPGGEAGDAQAPAPVEPAPEHGHEHDDELELEPPAASPGIDGITRRIAFPVLGPVSYGNDWGACRDGCARRHEGTDLLGTRMQPLLAAVDGTVTRVQYATTGISGAVITVTGDDGWYYNYFHVNDDTPGDDDGAAAPHWQITPGVAVGRRVVAGQVIAYMGDSGNAEWSVPHLHFEIRTPDRTPVNPYHSLVAAQRRDGCSTAAGWTNTPLAALSPSAVAVIPLSGGGRWVIDSDGRLHAEGPAAHIQPAGGGCAAAVAPIALPPDPAPQPVTPAAPAALPGPASTAGVSTPVAPAPVAPPAPPAATWTVAPGECLWDIVERHYGTTGAAATVAAVGLVVEHNRDVLGDPNVLGVGTTLVLPAR